MKKTKYSLHRIKKAGNRSTECYNGDFTCVLISRAGDNYFSAERNLHEDIFDMPSFGSFGSRYTWESAQELKNFRLITLAMTHEIARRLNNGEDIIDIRNTDGDFRFSSE